MSGRIDHAAEARRLADIADRHYGQIEHRNGAMAASQSVEALMVATEAQVHATLALVEQQRIANLLALGQATNADGSRIAPWAVTHPVDGWSVAVNDEIREGLGL